MDKGTGKKIALLAVFLVMLGALYLGVTRFGGMQGSETNQPKPETAPALDAAKLAAQWPQIAAHAVAPARGSTTAPYTLAEFGDFQCPQCGKARPLLEELLQKYPAQVNLIFVHRPFPQIHPWAIPAGQASELAAAQGKFWPMYDILYAHQDDLEPGFYGDYAAQAGLGKAGFQKAVDAGQDLEKVKAASAFSDSLGIQLTPTVLLHDRMKNTVTVYVGLNGTKMPDGSPQYAGINALVAHPPWGG